MDTPRQYFEELRDDTSLYPTWLPGDLVEVGTFGTLARGRFSKHGCLADLGIEMRVKEVPGKTDYKLSRGIKFRANAETNASGSSIDASGGITVHFERAHAWAFGARGTRAVEIANIFDVESKIRECFKNDKWQRKWLLITEIKAVDHLSVLVARKRNVEGTIIGKGAVVQPLDVLLSEDASFEFSNEDTFTVSHAKNKTPLYGVRKLTWRGEVAPVSGGPDEEDIPSLKPAHHEEFGD